MRTAPLRPNTFQSHLIRSAALWVALALLGCHRNATQGGPEHALEVLANALRRGDAKGAYELMSQDYRAHHSLQDFQKQVGHNKAEARNLADALTHSQKIRRYAEVELTRGDRILLESEAGRWLFTTPVVDFYPQGTPREALRTFVRAVEARRWDVVLDLMPQAERGDLSAEALGKNLSADSEELERLVALLKASWDSPIEEVVDRATMPYGESFTVRFVREQGRWKIEDPE